MSEQNLSIFLHKCFLFKFLRSGKGQNNKLYRSKNWSHNLSYFFIYFLLMGLLWSTVFVRPSYLKRYTEKEITGHKFDQHSCFIWTRLTIIVNGGIYLSCSCSTLEPEQPASFSLIFFLLFNFLLMSEKVFDFRSLNTINHILYYYLQCHNMVESLADWTRIHCTYTCRGDCSRGTAVSCPILIISITILA